MDTSENVITTGRRRRRHHSVFFKAEAVSACQEPGVSIAAVALARGLNANFLRRWIQEAERGDAPIAIRPATPIAAPSSRRISFLCLFPRARPRVRSRLNCVAGQSD